MRLSWNGHGLVGYPRTGIKVTHELRWETHPSGTFYEIRRYKGERVLGLWVDHSVQSYYGANWHRRAELERRY
jgi:hypothetical protein